MKLVPFPSIHQDIPTESVCPKFPLVYNTLESHFPIENRNKCRVNPPCLGNPASTNDFVPIDKPGISILKLPSMQQSIEQIAIPPKPHDVKPVCRYMSTHPFFSPTWRFPENRGTPKSSILIGFSLTKTIHFGVHPSSSSH